MLEESFSFRQLFLSQDTDLTFQMSRFLCDTILLIIVFFSLLDRLFFLRRMAGSLQSRILDFKRKKERALVNLNCSFV